MERVILTTEDRFKRVFPNKSLEEIPFKIASLINTNGDIVEDVKVYEDIQKVK